MDIIHDDDDLEIIDFIINGGLRRQIYIRNDHFHGYDNESFRKRFRISKVCAIEILQQIEMYLEFPTDRNNCVSPMNQLLLTLRLYSTGGHLLSVADFCGVHVSTACRIVRRVSEAIARLYRQYIQMATTPDDMMACQREFFNIASFPRVVGVIDCTHIKIDSLGGEDPEIFRNRKGYFSINVQMICDANLKIMNVVARWPGSSHDSTIFSNSRVRVNFEQNIYENCYYLEIAGILMDDT
ncbi:hypothetical protein PPYR_12777 [Photinus pyralis]|uniref:Putative nuclease HARBI1 n=1 Tax=Photinus pyralis TaxID=7054 RepID=A0A5N4A758_PHOPY|nr:hypothetical protein PPYR_12777 [Photinus pyralis]